jgi:hypothetical protein
MSVLQGKPVPEPFNLASKKEALMLLVHFVGDLHQPLHVAAMYLEANGKVVNPEAGAFDSKSDTHGGNSIGKSESDNLHHTWDETKYTLTAGTPPSAMVASAKALAIGPVDLVKSPAEWASDTVQVAKATAFQGLTTGPLANGYWPLKTVATYTGTRTRTQSDQVTKGGARLAALLEALWPDQN